MANELMPRVSIGLPVYNGERYLRQALDSLLGQTFTDIEIIISDNGSSDETRSIAQGYCTRDGRVRYIRQPQNLGAIGNFNFVFTEARGEYFKWAAHDDICEPTLVEACVCVLDDNAEVIWCHSESDQIDAEGNSWLERISPDACDLVEVCDGHLRWAGHPRQGHDSRAASQRFAGVLLGTTWAVDSYGLIRSAALRRTRMLLPYYGAEKVLLGELALQGPHYHIRDRLFAQRIHREASSNLDSSQFQASFAVGGDSRPFVPTRLALLRGHLGAVRHASISGWQRAKCFGVVARYVLQFGKWKQIVSESLSGRGMGGDGLRKLERQADLIHNNS